MIILNKYEITSDEENIFIWNLKDNTGPIAKWDVVDGLIDFHEEDLQLRDRESVCIACAEEFCHRLQYQRREEREKKWKKFTNQS